ncbi:sensor histidine kinase [Mammaliicoccus sciuri]|uniref:sensor histidine kinase n=1 Tax=Mammaliicoccus sciuri TaxID=1296 RepID=UPI003AE751D9
MKFTEYAIDKVYTFIFFSILMIFVSLMMFVSIDSLYSVNYILYTNLCAIVFFLLYIVFGYYFRNKFYLELKHLILNKDRDIVVDMIKPQNNKQQIVINLLNVINDKHSIYLQKLYDEKRDQQEFIISWIHEVKTPISASRLLLENSQDKSNDWLVNKTEDELDKIEGYIEKILYHSRIDSFSKDYFITEVNLDKIIRNSIKKYSKLFIDKNISIEIDEIEKYVQSDNKWLLFIIDQFISNSLKYTNSNGKIVISFEDDNQEKRLIIKDNGVGIKKEDINRVFEKGFTGHNGRNYSKSTGMGLFLSKQLASKLDHDITIKSNENIFTEITVHFQKNNNHYNLN